MKFFYKSRITLAVAIGFLCLVVASSFVYENPTCPIDYTGAPKALAPNLGRTRFCTGCHGDFTINSFGSVQAIGLPAGTYVPGQAYNFSVKINHNTADKTIWGFAVKAVNTANNNVVGTMSTTNGSVTVKGTAPLQTMELSHENAAASAAANTYTYVNLKWTAPVSPVANENSIRFYITGVACDGDGGEGGDYVYTTTLDAALGTLPITLQSFQAKLQNENSVKLNWQTAQENNTARFEIEASSNHEKWQRIGIVEAKGNPTITQSYAFTHSNAASTSGSLLYRLKMVDKDGAYTYSPIQTIMLKNVGITIQNMSAQPMSKNANSTFKIVSNNSKMIEIAVSDMSGKMLYRSNASLKEGTNQVVIPGYKVAKTAGIIYIRFSAAGIEKTFKQMVE